jgi:hypothetical protein
MKKPAAAPVNGILKKRPAGATGISKRPSAKIDEEPKPKSKSNVTALTQAALLQLQGASEDKIERWIDKLNNNEQMCLWKKYEKQRHTEGTHDDYVKATAGSGKQTKSRACLKVYLKTGTTKSTEHKTMIGEYMNINIKEQSNEWKNMQEAIAIWGQSELQARVLSGSIICRKNPDDPRYPQFLQKSEKDTERTVHQKGHREESKSLSAKDEFLKMSTMGNHGSMLSFEDTQESTEDDPSALARGFLQKKGKSAGPAHDLESMTAASDNYIEQFETASALADDAGDDKKIKIAMVQARGVLENMIDALSDNIDTTGAKSHKACLSKHLKALKSLKVSAHAKGVVKRAMQKAQRDAKTASNFIDETNSK